MLDIAEVQETVNAMALSSSRIRTAARDILVPKDGTEEAKDPARMHNALCAVEVVCSIVNIFSSIASPNASSTFTVITDLTINLNTNPFWVRNNPHLMPLLIAAVNASMDYRDMCIGPQEPKWEWLKQHNKWFWLDILPTIVFLTHGFAPTRVVSVEMKKTFAGLLDG